MRVEQRHEERQYNLVADRDQAAQLAAYDLVDARELAPVEITLGPQWRMVKPGECYHLDLPSLDLDSDAIVLARDFDPGSMMVKLTLVSEDPAKHAFALGQTGTAPPTPALGDPQERDETHAALTGIGVYPVATRPRCWRSMRGGATSRRGPM
ncbi:hypothetical protein [Croceicoccus sp. YJ47]|uniref:hypothetical protein n=1 Tax=Croceicoccus sp. YJ47 TaxID=2798724 RepID=UPI0019226A0E|nr:hypothetical protein [Croceicoccus sp. YJ47]QQN73879.1 hypothetical protein JD971_14185 [Croceicoccus sp. YJ47]